MVNTEYIFTYYVYPPNDSDSRGHQEDIESNTLEEADYKIQTKYPSQVVFLEGVRQNA